MAHFRQSLASEILGQLPSLHPSRPPRVAHSVFSRVALSACSADTFLHFAAETCRGDLGTIRQRSQCLAHLRRVHPLVRAPRIHASHHPMGCVGCVRAPCAHTHPLLRAFDNSVHPGMRWPWKKKERPDEVTNGLTASTSLRSSRAEWLVPSGPSAAITSAMPCLCMLLATWTQ
jgi:hypothetical protein